MTWLLMWLNVIVATINATLQLLVIYWLIDWLGDLTGFTTLSFYHCEVKTSKHYLDKYFTLTVIENGQLMHLYFKHANTVFTSNKALNWSDQSGLPICSIERERERSLLPAHSPPHPESDCSNCSLTTVWRVTFLTTCYCYQCNLRKRAYSKTHWTP